MKVSCITPTAGRQQFVQHAIAQFQQQDWPDKEMIVVAPVGEHHAFDDERIKVLHTAHASIGGKRNIACQAATGSIIVHIDDDDIYAPDWITRSVTHLLHTGADLTGLSSAYYLQLPDILWLYTYPLHGQPYATGNTMCYHKHVWQRNRFKEISEGEDTLFCAKAGMVRPHNYIDGFLAIIHGENTASHKQLGNSAFKKIEASNGE